MKQHRSLSRLLLGLFGIMSCQHYETFAADDIYGLEAYDSVNPDEHHCDYPDFTCIDPSRISVIKADVSDHVMSTIMQLDGGTARLDKEAPFVLVNDKGGNGIVFSKGNHTIKVQAFDTIKVLRGTVPIDEYNVIFEVTEIDDPTSPPEGTTTPETTTIPEVTTTLTAETAITPLTTARPTSDLDLDAVFLLIGQSNMAGRGYMRSKDMASIVNTWLLCNDTLAWVPAKNPLNWYSTIRKRDNVQRIGPGYGFSLKLQRVLPGLNVGLVVQARGATKIKHWQKGNKRGYYANAVKLALEAKKSGPLKAVLWHQGESDRDQTSTYMKRLTTLIRDLRTDLEDPNLPFIAGQLANPSVDGEYDLFNEMIVDLPNVVDNTGVVLVDETIGTDDRSHFDCKGQIRVGRRYCDEFLALATSI